MDHLSPRTPILQALLDIAQAIGGTLEPISLARLVSSRAAALLHADAASLLVWHEETRMLRQLGGTDEHDDRAQPDRPLGAGATGQALLRRQPVTVDDYPSWEHGLRHRSEQGVRASIAVPLLVANRPVGALSVRFHTPHVCTTGDVRTLSLLASQVAPALEAVRLHQAAQAEIAERKEAEAALRTAERQAVQSEKLRALGQMASGIAHDLNQSLALVAGYVDLAQRALLAQPPDVTPLPETLANIAQAARHGAQTVERLLAFARGHPDQPPELLELTAFLRDVAHLTAPRWRDAARAEGRDISLSVESPGAPVVLAAPAALREACTNLVFNAVDALPDGGSIRLIARREPNAVSLEVVDSGVGMPPDVQAHIFEPFFTTKGERGSGLGLAQVFGIVQHHGGSISVDSAPHRGTSFRLSFPLPPAEPAPTPSPPPPSLPHARRILAVEDEPALARLLTLLLTQHGHSVETALSAEQALARLAEGPYDVLLTDLGLGLGPSGWDLVAQARAGWPHLRLVLATGWGAHVDPAQVQAAGVAAVVPKPYRLADLLSAVGGGAPAS